MSEENNMSMSESEKQIIIENAKFLEYKGYVKSVEEHTIHYSTDEIDIIVGYEPYSVESDIFIKFKKENEAFDVGWIACVRGDIHFNHDQRLETVLILLSYIRENYDTLLNIDYCRESRKLVSEYIAKLKKEQKFCL